MPRFLLYLSIICFLFNARAHSANLILTKVWDTAAGPTIHQPGQPRFYRGSVCDNGTFYLTDARGRVVSLNAQGILLADVSGVQQANGLATACNNNSELVVASSGGLSRLKPDGRGGIQVLSSVPLVGIVPSRVVARPDGTFMMLTASGPQVIFTADSRARLLNSFGKLPALMNGSQAKESAFNGSLAYNPQTGRVLFLAENPYEFQIYDASMGLVQTIPRNDPDFRVMSTDASGNPLLADRVLRSAYLPSGDLVVEVIKRRVTTDNHLKTTAYLEIFDSQLNLKSTGISVAGFGQLQGISQDGTLYFYLITPRNGIHIITAQLTSQ